MSSHAGFIALIVLAVVVLAIGLVFLWRSRQKRSERLRSRFGPEYERAVLEEGNRNRAEKALEERVKRSYTFSRRPLSPADRQEFEKAWREVQAHFVDAPAEALLEADGLVQELMARRGYPVGDFRQQYCDLSVDYPTEVQAYRAAHEITDWHRQGRAGTEDLREALIHYRALYDELLGGGQLTPNEVKDELRIRQP